MAIEYAPVRKVLEGAHDQHMQGDQKLYCVGSVPSAAPDTPHQVVATQLTRDGTRDAAATVIGLVRSFPSVRTIMVSGIAAGIPDAGLGLGDIVSATEGVVDYSHLRVTGEGTELRRPLGDVSAAVLDADNRLAEHEIHGHRPWLTTLATLERSNVAFRRPSGGETTTVHRGAIGSADILLRDAILRDGLAHRHRIIALEMEASGVATAARLCGREFFVVRAISDLADQKKDDRWHGHAAAASTAYLHALLGALMPEISTPTRAGGNRNVDGLPRIVEALLGSRAVRDEHTRSQLIDLLPAYIRSGVPYSSTPRIHVISIVSTCSGYPSGREALLDSLCVLLGEDSPEFGALAAVIRQNWSRA
ncbi:effector-associated domain 2-containing protein [Paractinoplanes durhamensis]|uniref:effector-associated domain 2-containing protein n=1 Tax=Paractinoplanes durhamensis TaxID=113563 RepID=UPI00194519CF|nr:hypothetical protein [Actinoplanes durhamensis]